MVTYFTDNDLISFGTYLLSEKRMKMFQDAYDAAIKNGQKPAPLEEIVKLVHHADIQNWVYDLQNSIKEDSNKPTSEGHNSKNAGEDNTSEGTNSK